MAYGNPALTDYDWQSKYKQFGQPGQGAAQSNASELFSRSQLYQQQHPKLSQAGGGLGLLGLSGLAPVVDRGVPLGGATLLQILSQQGHIDPMLMNQQLAGISRTGQGAQDAFRGQAAGQGLGRSGVAQAIQAAMGQGTRDQLSGRVAQEGREAEDRKRNDLNQFYNLLIGPSLDAYAVERGQALGNRQLNQQQGAANQSFWADLFGGVLGAFG